jgi:signal transduction histidine kinase
VQQQLLQSKKSEVTAQLAGGVADRFGKLINGIEGDAQVLTQRCQDPAAAEPLKRIATTAGCAAGLTRQLLALVGKHPMLPQAIDLNELIENQSGTLSRLMGTKIALEKVCWSNLPQVSGDPALIVQILHNLVLNARDAMPNGGTLSITTAPIRVDDERARRNEEARPGTFVCLTVGDTGCGIPPEVQAKLFEPFFTTKTTGNAGLGLATVHGLVKQHSGWIEVQSQPGDGSRFSVFFPTAATMARRSPVEQVLV